MPTAGYANDFCVGRREAERNAKGKATPTVQVRQYPKFNRWRSRASAEPTLRERSR